MKLTFTLNGEIRTRDVHPMKRLLDVLRDDTGAKGAKEGCGEGECGACAVIMNGRLVNSCMIPAMQAAGSEITTVAGLGSSVAPDPLQKAFVEEGAVQCGFCTPAMILAARSLLERKNSPTIDDIRTGLSGNLCRCTGYEKIYRAINRAVREGYSEGLRPRVIKPTQLPEFSPDEADKFFCPESLADALQILSRTKNLKIIAGCTDIMPDMMTGKFEISSAMDITRIQDLNGIIYDGREIRIGSCTTNARIIDDGLLKEKFPILASAAAKCGAVAIQNAATIGGNIVNASGAADMAVALFALDAELVIVGKGGENRVPIQRFATGTRATVIKPDEILKEIIIPQPSIGSKVSQEFYKRGSRTALTLSRVSLACYLERRHDGIVTRARFAAGSMSPVPKRLKNVERVLDGSVIDKRSISMALAQLPADISPRKSPEYRKKITENLLRKFLESAMW